MLDNCVEYGDSGFGSGGKPIGYGYGVTEGQGYVNATGGGGDDTASVVESEDATGYGMGDADGYGSEETSGE